MMTCQREVAKYSERWRNACTVGSQMAFSLKPQLEVEFKIDYSSTELRAKHLESPVRRGADVWLWNGVSTVSICRYCG